MDSLRRLSSPAAQQAAHTSASSEAAPVAPEAITKGGLISGERLMWDANERRGMLELRHKEILARIDILNQMSTQAMLIAGAAVTGLGGESLQVVNEEGLREWGSRCRCCSSCSSSSTSTLTYPDPNPDSQTNPYLTNSWDGVFGTLFVGTAAATLTSSLWVIFTSTHLVELSQQSALHGTDARDVKEADGILEERMREVHMFYVANPNPSPNPNPNCKPQPQPQPQPQPHP